MRLWSSASDTGPDFSEFNVELEALKRELERERAMNEEMGHEVEHLTAAVDELRSQKQTDRMAMLKLEEENAELLKALEQEKKEREREEQEKLNQTAALDRERQRATSAEVSSGVQGNIPSSRELWSRLQELKAAEERGRSHSGRVKMAACELLRKRSSAATVHRATAEWRSWARTKQNMLCIRRKIILAIRRGRRATSFRRWVGNVQEKRKAGRSDRLISRLRSRHSGGAFVRWHESVAELRAMRSKSRLIVLRWKLKAVGDCMATWGDAVRQRRVARRCVSRMTQRRLAASFELWIERLEELARAEAEEERKKASAGRIVLHLVWACVCDVCMHALRVWG
jgi:hypothetical protein